MSLTLTATVDGIHLCAKRFKAEPSPKNMTLFCLSGGGLTRDYFDLAPDYSFVKRMTAGGYDVLTMDHPGIASNTLPENHPYFTPRQAADWMCAALSQWQIGSPLIGVGHSLGGMMIMLMQGRQSPFSGLGLFGSSAGGLDWGLSEQEKQYINNPDKFAKDLEALALAKFSGYYTQGGGGPSGESILFGGENADITKRLREISCEMNSAGAMMSMMRGVFRLEVEAIDVPILFAFGDHDIGIPPEDAPKDFVNAASTELVVLENTGHNHFAFSSISVLCERLDKFVGQLELCES